MTAQRATCCDSIARCDSAPSRPYTADGNKVTIFFDISGWFGKL